MNKKTAALLARLKEESARRKVPQALEIPHELPENFTPTPESGITDADASQRQAQGMDNRPPKKEGKGPLAILAGNLFTFFNLLNVLLALALVSVGAWRNMLFLGVVVCNTLIGTVQELRARRTIRKLTLLSSAPSRVIRGGQQRDVRAEELVRDDLVILRAGDQIPADAVVVSGTGAANEALLTGESAMVPKSKGDWLLSGSYLNEGRVTAQLVYVGEESYARRLTKSAKAIKPPQSELMRSLNRLVKILTCILIPLGIALFCRQHFLRGSDIERAVPQAVASMIGMIPEGLVLLTSMALMMGVMRLGRKGALVNGLYGIETLARVDTLCLDKTGTLTTGGMHVHTIEPLPGFTGEEVRTAMSRFTGAFSADSSTLKALTEACPPTMEKVEALLPFNAERKLSAAAFSTGETLMLGAPAFVLGDGYRGALRDRCEAVARHGERVLILCRVQGGLEAAKAVENRVPMGLFFLTDELRPHVRETLTWFVEQDVTLKVISGDDPLTVSVLAERAGLPNADRWLDASGMSPSELAAHAEDYTVFGRVTPEGKLALVEALRSKGHTVAMTGDGVNDIPAMKASDCAVAMAGGSDAVRHAAQLTLLNGDFNTMPAAVAEGRRVINNITRAAALFLTKTGYSFALSLLLLFLPAEYPFQPIQLTLISTLTIGIPSFFLAMEANNERVTGEFLQIVIRRAAPCAAAVTLCASIAMLLEGTWPIERCTTMATILACSISLANLACICVPPTWLRVSIFALMVAGCWACITFAGHLFYLEPLTGEGWRIMLPLMLIGLCGVIAGNWLVHRWEKKVKAQKAASSASL